MMATAKLTSEMIPSAARLLAEAFLTNPAHVYICPNLETRLMRLEWLLGTNLRMQPESQASFCLADGAKVRAMGFWTKSKDPKIGVLEMLRVGLLRAPIRLGFGGTRRMLEVASEIDESAEVAMSDTPYWYLHNMAVREDLRGSGLGGKLLADQLDVIANQEPSAVVVLATQRMENVTFYGRLGFEVVTESIIGTGSLTFTNWIMRRARDA